ncbi:MAG: hypothetical protein QOE27_1160, partial [Solirubrobacteraceae bacterium]|nr:hypothetical protein [Solirubrobacteraceae bacterium]
MAVLMLLPGAAAAARTRLHACGDRGRLTCGRVSVRLDPTGRVPGRVSLFVERYSEVAHPSGTLVALAGGPGQSGVGVLSAFRTSLRPALGNRALLVFDERGIGRSGPLTCRVPTHTSRSFARIFADCVASLGRRARFYSSDDTVRDIESIRRALRLGRIDLYGVSYGTFPATQYARRYPTHLARLVLDSTLPVDGDDDVKLNSLISMRRQLRSACTPPTCPGLDPTADLTAVFAAADRAPLVAPVDPGKPPGKVTAKSARSILYIALLTSDLDPLLRASIPAAIRLGAEGDGSALLRLKGLSEAIALGSAERTPDEPPDPEQAIAAAARTGTARVNLEPIATRCEDERFVWSAHDRLAVRVRKVAREASLLSPAAVAPFDAATAIGDTEIASCERWPSSGSHPPREAGPLPAVPTLVLSGAADVRTPFEQAQVVAAEIPGASVLEVPNVGHAVLLNDPSGCATRALGAFFAGTPVAPCGLAAPPPVDPLPPGAVATLPAAAPLTGLPGQVLTASVLTLRHEVGITAPYAENLLAGPIAGT